MLDWRQLAQLPTEILVRRRLDEIHLACAVDLPGSEGIDIQGCTGKIDEYVAWVRRYTDHCLAKNGPDPDRLGETEAQTRMRCLITVLWQGAGLRYYPGMKDNHSRVAAAYWTLGCWK